MSGGFFRGTSADQDTRFSNKQAKLMKSQKFAPELEHLVEMTKVKMDVIRPWIANRVTELLGFEDEVLINFINSLLEKKVVNGKEVQISLTGFMEKNTAKFMKELWTLLLSAQKNASGVPQQFLDAKEEETRKKKVEADRIAFEIEKKKDKERELEQERLKKMDGMVDTRATNSGLEPNSKPRASSHHPEDEEEAGKRNNGVRGRYRVSRSPHSARHSPSSPRGSPSRSMSRSFSNPRSFSGGRHQSRSVSRSPEARGRSVSSERVYRSPQRRPVTPRRRNSPLNSLSPSRRRSSYSRRRSRSRSLYRSPSPVRRRLRSPFRRRTPSPVRRRRSPSPFRRRRSPSPIRRRRSPSPIRRRRSPSPVRRRRTPSPVRRRSPPLVQRRSPSPVRRRSPSPIRRRSPSPIRRRSPSPLRQRPLSPVRRRYRRSPTPRRSSPSLVRHRSPIPSRRRSPLPSRRRSPPHESSSPSPIQRTSPSPVRRKSPKHQRSPPQSSKERIRAHEKLSPLAQRSSSSLRSPQRDARNRSETRNKVSVSMSSPEKSPTPSKSPPQARKRVPSEDRRSFSPYKSSPVRQAVKQMIRDGSVSPARKSRHDSLEISEEGEEPKYAREEDVDHKSKPSHKRSVHSSAVNKQKDSPVKVPYKEGHSPKNIADYRATGSQARSDNMELRKKEEETKSEKSSRRGVRPESPGQHTSPTLYKESLVGDRQHPPYPGDGKISDEKNRSRSNDVDNSRRRSETVQDSVGKLYHNKQAAPDDSSSEESDKHRTEEKKRRKHKRSERKEVASDDSYDSELEDRKGAKRRRKEEKKLRKEEKRRRREERRRKKEERRAEKLKVKNKDDAYASDGEHSARRESYPSDDEDMQAEQTKLEIELRKKALESLKAKKGISH